MAPFAAEENSESYRHNVFEYYENPWLEPELIDVDLSPQVNRVVSNPLNNVLAAVLGERVVVFGFRELANITRDSGKRLGD